MSYDIPPDHSSSLPKSGIEIPMPPVKRERPVTPLVTVDIIIELLSGKGIVLIERKNPPAGYALPGGFVDVGERTIEAAAREAFEETSLRVSGLKQFHTYSSPSRDPRGHGITVVYVGHALGHPDAQDDAKEVICLDLTSSRAEFYISELCFDHAEILADYVHWKQTGELPTRE